MISLLRRKRSATARNSSITLLNAIPWLHLVHNVLKLVDQFLQLLVRDLRGRLGVGHHVIELVLAAQVGVQRCIFSLALPNPELSRSSSGLMISLSTI